MGQIPPRRLRAPAEGPDVDDYVVRVYRWGAGGEGPASHVVGVVERVGDEGRKAFHTLEELWRILSTRPGRRRRGRRRRPPP